MSVPNDLPAAPLRSMARAEFASVETAFNAGLYAYVPQIIAYAAGFSVGTLTLTALPPVPTPQVQGVPATTYMQQYDTFLAALPAFVSQLNLFAGEVVITPLPPTPNRSIADENYLVLANTYLAAYPLFKTQVDAYDTWVASLAGAARVDTARVGDPLRT